jgi:peroxiredoxin
VPCQRQLGQLQANISEIRQAQAEIVALSSGGNRKDVERTREVLGITFPMVPSPVFDVAEAYGVWDNQRKLAIATVINDKAGVVRFSHQAVRDDWDRPSVSQILRVLRDTRE